MDLYIHISSRTFGHQWGRLTRKSITNVTTYKGRHQENNLGVVGRAGGGRVIPTDSFQYSYQSTRQKLGWVTWVSQVGNV